MTYDDWKTESPEEERDRENSPQRRTRADFLMDEADYLRDRDHESQSMTGQLVAEDEDDFEPGSSSASGVGSAAACCSVHGTRTERKERKLDASWI